MTPKVSPTSCHSVLSNSGSLVITWSLSLPSPRWLPRGKDVLFSLLCLMSQLPKTHNPEQGPGTQPHLRVPKEKVSPRTMGDGRREERKFGCPFSKCVPAGSTASGSETNSPLSYLLHTPQPGKPGLHLSAEPASLQAIPRSSLCQSRCPSLRSWSPVPLSAPFFPFGFSG